MDRELAKKRLQYIVLMNMTYDPDDYRDRTGQSFPRDAQEQWDRVTPEVREMTDGWLKWIMDE